MPAPQAEGTMVRYRSGIENTKYKSATQEKHNSSSAVWPIKIILTLTCMRPGGNDRKWELLSLVP
ncbi:MAG: hypothetical protein JWQ40_2811 [Segetibacter sp.]|nr:hypothetical protein [Segetibacter sp.]